MANTNPAALMASEIIAECNEMCMDTDTTAANRFMTPTEDCNLLSDWWCWWAEKFTNRIIGISASTVGFILGTNASTLSGNLIAVTEFLHLYWEANSSDVAVGPELEIIAPNQIISLQQADATYGTPRYVSVEHVASGLELGSVQPSQVGLWKLRPYPIPDPANQPYYISALVRRAPFRFDSSVLTDRPDCGYAESLVIARLMAVDKAGRMGREPEFINNIASPLDAGIKQALMAEQRKPFKAASETMS